jgi:hypothetical protein
LICSREFSSVLEITACPIPHAGFWLQVDIRKPTFITWCELIKKIYFRFEPFKHFCWHFVWRRFLIIQIFWNLWRTRHEAQHTTAENTTLQPKHTCTSKGLIY